MLQALHGLEDTFGLGLGYFKEGEAGSKVYATNFNFLALNVAVDEADELTGVETIGLA